MDKDVKINLSIKDIRRSRLTKWVTVVLVFLLVNIALVSFTGQSLFGWIGSLLKLMAQFAVVLYLTK
jgi:Flp pilus assembly protein protease CpaA